MATLTDAQIAQLAVNAGFPKEEIATAVAVALAESGGRTDAVNSNRNGSTDYGVWQINTIHGVSQADMFDPVKNAAKAFQIWKAAKNRWTPWSVFNNLKYRTFMVRGAVAAGGAGSVGADVGGSASGAVASVNPFAALFDRGLWLRIAMALLGGLLLLFGMVKLTGIGSTGVKLAKNLIPAAKALPI
jgi:hypothetical protein